MKNPKDYATIQAGPGRGAHAQTVEAGDNLTLFFSYAEPVAVRYRGTDGRFVLAVRETEGACATHTTRGHVAAIEAEYGPKDATRAERLRARYNADAFAQLLAELLEQGAAVASLPSSREAQARALEQLEKEEAIKAAWARAIEADRKAVRLKRALRVALRCPAIHQTDQTTGETFAAIINRALEA